MNLSAGASSNPLDGIQFGEVAARALDLGASECTPGALLQTGAVLDALARVDVLGNWTRIWLHTGAPESLHLVDIQDESSSDSSQGDQIKWADIPLSGNLIEALKILRTLAEINSMSVVLPGALALALVTKPTFGATRALLSGGGLDHSGLLDLVQMELLATTLKGIENLISENIPTDQPQGAGKASPNDPEPQAELTRLRRVLGEDHPDTLASATNLASSLRILGEHERTPDLNEDSRRGEGGHFPLERALVRIWRDDVPVGGGFLVGPAHLFTAAHVVADVLGVDPDGPAVERARVLVDFPLVEADRLLSAELVVWVPEGTTDPLGDIAGLRLLEPPPSTARALVVSIRHPLDDQVVMLGFPRGLPFGSWLHGRLGGTVATGWREILSEPTHGAAVERGFSGTPVWSSSSDAAVGMVVRSIRGAPPKIGYLIGIDTLLNAWPEVRELIERRSPFRGLRPFAEADAAVFYGRDDEATQIVALIRAGASAVGVIGPSGIGKSSLCLAGVLPRLRSEPGLLIATTRPSDATNPVNALALALDRLDGPERRLTGRLDAAHQLAERIQRGALADIAGELTAKHGCERLLIVVDQLEEVFNQPTAEQAAFGRALCAAFAPAARLSLLVTLRDSFLGQAQLSSEIGELVRRWSTRTIGDLSIAALRVAITEPVARIGTVDYAPGLVERILDELSHASSPLPLMQFTLAELWERRHGGLLTHDAYDAMGGVQTALSGYADGVWAALDTETRDAAERLLVQLIQPLPGKDLYARRTALRSELDEPQWSAAQRLATTRLLVLHEVDVSEQVSGLRQPVAGIELAHESLLTQWLTAQQLATRYRDLRIWQESLRQRMATWLADGSGTQWLLSGADLRQATRWAKQHSKHLSADELKYIAASSAHRRLRQIGLAVMLVIVLIAGIVTYRVRDEHLREIAAADLATKAKQLANFDHYGALQLALRAYRTDSKVDLKWLSMGDYDGVDHLIPAYQYGIPASVVFNLPPQASGANPRQIPVIGSANSYNLTPMISADGRTLVTTDASSRIVVWRIEGNQLQAHPLSRLFGPSDFTAGMTLSRSGHYVAFVQHIFPTVPKSIRAPVDSQGLPIPLPSAYPGCQPGNLATQLDCLVVYDTEQEKVRFAVRLSGTPTGAIPRLSIDPTDQVLGVVSPDVLPRTNVTPTENTVQLWDMASGQLRQQLRLPERSAIGEVTLGIAGRTAIVLEIRDGDGPPSDKATLGRYELEPIPQRRQTLTQGLSHPGEMAQSSDGRTVAAVVSTPEGSKRIRVWDSETGSLIGDLGNLSAEQSRGSLVLGPTGRTVSLDWVPDLRASKSGNIWELLNDLGSRISTWSLPDGAPAGEPGKFRSAWSIVLPLGNRPEDPVLVVRGSIFGIVFPDGQVPPLRRLTDAATRTGNRFDPDRLCSLLYQPNDDAKVRSVVPPGVDQGPLCP